jgi:hypothetical protein
VGVFFSEAGEEESKRTSRETIREEWRNDSGRVEKRTAV